MHKFMIAFCIMLLVLAGCGQQDIIEDIGFIHTIGYDVLEHSEDEGKLRVTISFPLAEEETAQTLSTVAETSKEARIILSNKSDKNLVTGQVRSIFIGKELAEKGIWQQMDTIYRDPVFRPNIKLAVIDGKAQELIESENPNFPKVNQSIENLLKKEARLNTIPDMDVHKFSKDYFDDGIDPIAPFIKSTNEGMMASGIALFKNDQFVTTLNTLQSRIFFLLTGDFKKGDLFHKNGNEKILIDFLSNKRKFNVKVSSPDDVEVYVNIKFTGYILEYQGDKDTSNKNDIKQLEKGIQAYIEEEINDIIEIMQQYKVDNIGIGKYIRLNTNYDTWKKMKWPETIDNAKITPHVSVEILDTGLTK
ncbi:Ger(x)C family spore germination protein [Siminovitchia sediminis]|uniref:Ger(X)C family spore germination protein n=1 Tax=Siminovitchia sediminis TaxID=1274353 RepID=A0ABW4KLE9_9BACI